MNFKTLLFTAAVASTGFIAPAAEAASCSHLSGVALEQCQFAPRSFANPGTYAAPTAPAPRAQAVQTAPRYLPGEQALLNAIANVGVPVNVGQCEDDGSYGYFAYRTNTWNTARIQICTNVATDKDTQWETLRHEAVHVAQKCENRDHGNSFETLTTWSFLKGQATDSDANFVMSAYPEAKWLIEIEAFTFQKKSNQTIANLVNKACN